MVATRSQDHHDHASSSPELRARLEATPLKVPEGKRRSVDPPPTETKPRSSIKRRKMGDAQPSLEMLPTTLAAVVIPIISHEAAGPQVRNVEEGSVPENISIGSDSPRLKERKRRRSSGEHDEGKSNDAALQSADEEVRLQVSANVGEPVADEQPAAAAATEPTASPGIEAKKPRDRDSHMDLITPIDLSSPARSSKSDGRPESRRSPCERSEAAPIILLSPRPSSSTPERSPESSHKPFSNEETTFVPSIVPSKGPLPEENVTRYTVTDLQAKAAPEAIFPEPPTMRDSTRESKVAVTEDPSPERLDTRGTIQDSEADYSSDEAPEVVTQSTGLEKARSAAAEATKAVEAQRAAGKQKRREHDTLLKLQAKATKKEAEQTGIKDTRLEVPTDDRAAAPPQAPASEFRWSRADPLPALLPDELLATEPMPRLPTPSPEPLEPALAKVPINKRQRFLEETSKPPKDVRKGNVKIRVLEDSRAILPPKVSKQSQSIRESWLAGRPGAKGKAMMERRKMRGGFVRT
ncbi:MAG: hypothetical protein Q9207_004648 [Kuettlingeria erythrocarpa]